MICGSHPFQSTAYTAPRLCPWFVFAILFPPFNLLVTSATHVHVGTLKDLFRLFRVGVVTVGKGILMSWTFATGLWGHGVDLIGVSARD